MINNLPDRIEEFVKNKRKIFLFISIFVAIVLAGLLFDMKISTGEDDASYILAAQKFIDGEAFPTWHGSFYPIFLSFFLKIFGLKLFLLKLLSFLMIIVHIYIIYFAFRDKTPWVIIIGVILYSSVCLEILYFGGQTYSEALYLLLQISVFAAFYRICHKNSLYSDNISKQWKEWLIFGFLMFLLSITRNVGWSIIFAALVYFLTQKKFRYIIATVLSVSIFYVPYNIYKSVYWKIGKIGFEGQFEKMFWINPYDENIGHESFSGFVQRFIENSEIYLSKYFLMVLGWKDSFSTNTFLTILFYFLFIFTFIVIFKKRKELLFPLIYLAFAIGATFITQQTMWDQIRLILIYVPLSVLLFSTALWNFFDFFKKKILKILPVIILLAIIIPSFVKTVNISIKHYPILKANIQGDMLYGYTNDWKNYLKVVKWTAENLPKDYVVACRKPGMAYIFSEGRKFFGIYNVESYTVNQIFEECEKKSDTTNHYFFDFFQSGDLFYTLFPYFINISSIVLQDDGRQYICFEIPEKIDADFQIVLEKTGISYYNLEQAREIMFTDRLNDYGVYPDSLLNFLEKNKIDFLILGRLRMIPEKKTDEYITTMHRYVYFIELKYPALFSLVWQEGKNEDEPAILLKVDYNKIK